MEPQEIIVPLCPPEAMDANTFRAALLELGEMSQREFSIRCGATPSTVSRWATGRLTPIPPAIVALIAAYLLICRAGGGFERSPRPGPARKKTATRARLRRCPPARVAAPARA